MSRFMFSGSCVMTTSNILSRLESDLISYFDIYSFIYLLYHITLLYHVTYVATIYYTILCRVTKYFYLNITNVESQLS